MTKDDPAKESSLRVRSPNDDLPPPLNGAAFLLGDLAIAIEYDGTGGGGSRDIKTFKSLDFAGQFYRQMSSAGKNPQAQKLVAATAAVERAKRKMPLVAGNSAADRSPQLGVPVMNFEDPTQQPVQLYRSSDDKIVRNGTGDGSLLGIPEMQFANPID